MDGWTSRLLLLDDTRPEEGGLQLLWKATRFGRIAYVSKGPVLRDEGADRLAAVMQRLRSTAHVLGLQAVIVQPPDESRITVSDLARHGFGRSAVPSVIRSTAIASLDGGREAFLARMNRQARREARLARERGVVLKLGTRADLTRFHELMTRSSLRQGSRPSPNRPEVLECLWDVFQPHICLGLAMLDSEPIAGLLMIGHGRRLTFWKKGWDDEAPNVHANCYLNVEALGWAADRGYALVDFAGVDLGIAENVSAQRPLTAQQRRSRDLFNLRLGAQPKLLPPAQLLVLRPGLRQLYRVATWFKPLERHLLHKLSTR